MAGKLQELQGRSGYVKSDVIGKQYDLLSVITVPMPGQPGLRESQSHQVKVLCVGPSSGPCEVMAFGKCQVPACVRSWSVGLGQLTSIIYILQ